MAYDRRYIERNLAYGVGKPLIDMAPIPVVADRAPTTKDRAEIGTPWIYNPGKDVFFLVDITAGVSTWINAGGGSGTFTSVTTTSFITAGDSFTMSSGTCHIEADDDAADAILLETDGGTSETIHLNNVQGTGAAAINVTADVGAIRLDAGLASAAALKIVTSNAAGGIDMDSGTGGTACDSTGSITIASTNDAAQAILLNTNGGTSETIDIVASQGTAVDSVAIGSTVGGIDVNAGAALINALTLRATNIAGGITMTAGTGGLNLLTTGGQFVVEATEDATQAILLTTDGGTSETMDLLVAQGTALDSLSLKSTAGGIDVDSGLASSGAITIEASHAAGGIDILAGTGGITLDSDGFIDMVPVADSQAAAAVTINANVGVGTFTGLTVASAASQVFTVTNSLCTTTSAILCTMANVGTNDAQMSITRVEPKAGSFEVTCINEGAAALNGDCILTFWIIAA